MKRLSLFLLILAGLLTACSTDDDDDVMRQITSIEIQTPAADIFIGGTYQLTVKHNPEDLEAPVYKWVSSDEAVATIDENGEMKALTLGEVKITASVEETELVAELDIVVKPIEATSIKLDKETNEITVGDSFTLTASIEPDEVTSTAVTWTTSNKSIATVVDGEVKAMTEGEVTITATIGSLEAKCVVTVKPTPVTAITLNEKKKDMTVGSKFTLTAGVVPENAPHAELAWRSSNEAIATVENGVVTAIAEGEATIIVSLGKMETKCVITVKPVTVTAIRLNENNRNMSVGEKFTLSISIEPSNAKLPDLVWSSSDVSVAGVDQNGEVKAIALGEATITVKTADGKLDATCTIAVKPIAVTGVKFSTDKLSLVNNGTASLTYGVLPENASNKQVTIVSSNPSIVNYDAEKGIVTALDFGTTTLTVTTEDGKHSSTCVITVLKATNLLEISYKVGNSGTSGNTVTATDVELSLKNISPEDITNARYGIKYKGEENPAFFTNIKNIKASATETLNIDLIEGVTPHVDVRFTIKGIEYKVTQAYKF